MQATAPLPARGWSRRLAIAGERWSDRYLPAHAVLMYLFLYTPILIVIVYSFNASRLVTTWEGLSLRWYAEAWRDESVRESLRNSFVLGLLSMVLSTALGTTLALGLRRAARWLQTATVAVMYMTIVIPPLVFGISLLLFFVRLGAALSLLTVAAGHVVFNTSYVAFIVRARLAGMGDTLVEAAYDLGARPWSAFWLVTFPLLLPAVLAGALLVFAFSFDDFVVTFFLNGPASTTLPQRIFGMLRFGVSPVANAVATVALALTLTALTLVGWLLGRFRIIRLS